MRKTILIELKPYKKWVYVIAGYSDKGFDSELKKIQERIGYKLPIDLTAKEMGLGNIGGENGAVTYLIPEGDSVIRMNPNNKPNIIIEHVYHEIFHAISHSLRSIGLNHIPSSEEAYAYLLGDTASAIASQLLP